MENINKIEPFLDELEDYIRTLIHSKINTYQYFTIQKIIKNEEKISIKITFDDISRYYSYLKTHDILSHEMNKLHILFNSRGSIFLKIKYIAIYDSYIWLQYEK